MMNYHSCPRHEVEWYDNVVKNPTQLSNDKDEKLRS